MRPRLRFLLPVLPLVLIATTDCYTYVPTQLETVPIGSSVRTLLSTEASLSLGQRIGFETTVLSGRLLERDERGVLLLVRGAGTGRAVGSAALYQRVDLTPPDVVRVDLKVLNKVRTGGVIAALLGVATVALVRAFGDNNPGSPPNSGPNPVE